MNWLEALEARVCLDAVGSDVELPFSTAARLPAVTADLTGDGLADLVFLQDDGVYLRVNTGGGTFGGWRRLLELPNAGSLHAAAGRFTSGDEFDLAVSGPGGLRLLKNDGRGNFAAMPPNTGMVPGGDLLSVAADGAGKRESLVGSGRVVKFGDGGRVAVNRGLPVSGLQGLIAADLNGDGREDLVQIASSAGTGEVVLRALLSGGNGRFDVVESAQRVSPGNHASGWSLAARDLNGDGRADVVLVSSQSAWRAYSGEDAGGWGLGAFTRVAAWDSTDFGLEGDREELRVVGFAQIDGDAEPELLLDLTTTARGGAGDGIAGGIMVALQVTSEADWRVDAASDSWGREDEFTLPIQRHAAADLNGDGLSEVFGWFDRDHVQSPVTLVWRAPSAEVRRPVIGGATVRQAGTSGEQVSIRARGVSDTDGRVREVRVYWDVKGDGSIARGSAVIAADATERDGWTVSFSTDVLRSRAGDGPWRLLVVAVDNQGFLSEGVAVMVEG